MVELINQGKMSSCKEGMLGRKILGIQGPGA